MACVEVPELPLQLLLREHPGWQGHPVAVVEADRPTAVILAVNAAARDAGVRTGERYGPVLARVPALRAGPEPAVVVAEAQRDWCRALAGFSPTLEPHPEVAGVGWLDAGGLVHMHPSLAAWAQALRDALRGLGLRARVAVGFHRFATWAVARTLPGGVRVFDTVEAERAALATVPIAALGLPPPEREALLQLGVTTVEALLALPPDGLSRRFGPAVLAAWRFGREDDGLPLQPHREEAPPTERAALPHGEQDLGRLVFAIKPLVDALLVRLAARGEALAALTLRFSAEGDEALAEEVLRPATPTCASLVVMELVRLRLEARAWAAPVVEVVAVGVGGAAPTEQLEALAARPRRDPAAAARAFARLRAAFGEGAVVRPVLVPRHTPEHRWRWEPVERLVPASPGAPGTAPLVRVLLARPRRLRGPAPPEGLVGWCPLGEGTAPVVRSSGPFRLVGAWWRRPLGRDYHHLALADGRLLWVFQDLRRGAWHLHGAIA